MGDHLHLNDYSHHIEKIPDKAVQGSFPTRHPAKFRNSFIKHERTITYPFDLIIITIELWHPQQCTTQSQPDTQTSSAIPLPTMNTPPPCLATPASSYETPQQSTALSTPSSTKELISPPAKNTRSMAKGKKLFQL